MAVSYPGVYVEELAGGVRAIAGVPTSVALFVGWAPRGSAREATRLRSSADFERHYGRLDRRALLGYSVKHFFDNGGSDAYVLRIVGSDAATARVASGDLAIEASSPGAWANDYRVRATPRGRDRSRFRLEVLHAPSGDAVVESFDDVSMAAADARFVPRVVNGHSALVTIAVRGTMAPRAVTVGLGAGTAGSDGAVVGPADASFRARLLASFGAGSVTDRIDVFSLLCVPGLTDAATIAALQTECRRRRAFMIIDVPESETVATLPGMLSALGGIDAMNSALYFPWVRAADADQQGALRSFPASGFVAGVYARTDATRGVWKAPAGSEAAVNGAAGLAIMLSDAETGRLNPLAINCLRSLPVHGTVVWGARTLHGNDERGSPWKYVPVRRLALFLEESLHRGLDWVAFEPNGEPLWAQVRLSIGAFMHNLFRQAAFQGASPRDAYFVRCDATTTTHADVDAGVVNIQVGFAPLKPAEFLVIKLQKKCGPK